MADIPSAVQTVTVTGLFNKSVADTGDAGTLPDLIALSGKITFTPNQTRVRVSASVPPMTLFPQPIETYLDGFGYLTGPDRTTRGVSLVGTGALIATYTIKFQLNDIPEFSIIAELPAGTTVDLATVLELPNDLAADLAAWRAVAIRADEAATAAEASAVRAAASAARAGTGGTGTGTGANGREIELTADATNIKWRYVGDTIYTTLVSRASLKGDPGAASTVPGPASTVPGPSGTSAYQTWLNAGNSGTEAAFLASLRGPAGAASTVAGPAGLSAYQTWLALGNTGTEAQFIASLKGAAGTSTGTGNGGTVVVGPAAAVRSTAMSIALARFAKRDTLACPVVSMGSSTWYGQGADTDPQRTMNRFVTGLQVDLPFASGAAQPLPKYLSDVAGTTLPAGIQYVNASASGTNSSTFITDAQAQQIMALKPALLSVAVGPNDYASNVAPATYKTQLLAWFNRLRDLSTAPYTLMLVWGHRRPNPTNPTYNWADYGQALKEIADANPGYIVFLDLYTQYRAALQDTTDPYGYNLGDGIHLSPGGHGFGGDLMRDAMRGLLPFNSFTYQANPGTSTPALTNSTTPTISGTTTQGQTLTVSNGVWSQTPDSFTYQWKRNGTAISGATAATYLLVATDVGTVITVTVTAVKSGYTSGTATSAGTSSIGATATPALTSTTSPAVTPASVTVGGVLTTTTGAWSATPDSYTYQWYRAGAAISGATSASYTTVTADAGQAITVTVVAIKSGYTNGTATSGTVTPAAAASSGSGTALPDVTTGMMVQYKSASLSGAEGAAVPSWTVTAGSVPAATMNSAVAVPTLLLNATPTGKQAIRLSGGATGTASRLTVLGDVLTVPLTCTYFYVIRKKGAMTRAIGSGNGESGRYHALFDALSTGGVQFNVGSVSTTATEALVYSGPTLLDQWAVIAVRSSGATSRMRLSVLDTVTTPGTPTIKEYTATSSIPGTNVNFGITVGASGGNTNTGQFDIAELRAFNVALSDADIDTVIAKLRAEYLVASASTGGTSTNGTVGSSVGSTV